LEGMGWAKKTKQAVKATISGVRFIPLLTQKPQKKRVGRGKRHLGERPGGTKWERTLALEWGNLGQRSAF